MALYRLTKGSHSGLAGDKRVEYHAGVKGQDIIELTDAQAALPHLRKRIEKVHGEDVGASAGSRESPNRSSAVAAGSALDLTPDEDSDETDPKIAAVLSGNVDQVLTYISDHEGDDETLEALREGELAGKARKGVLDAINALLGE